MGRQLVKKKTYGTGKLALARKLLGHAVSAKNFYGKAKKAIQYGKKVGKAIKSYRKKSTKGRIARISSEESTQHNDWQHLPFMKLKVGNPAKKMKTIGKFYLDHTNNTVLTQVIGYQAVAYCSGIATRDQLVGNVSANFQLGAYATSWATDPFLLNPYSTPAVNAIYSLGAPPAVADADTIFINSITTTFRFVSLENIAQRVKVFWLLCKKTNNVSPPTLWANHLNGGDEGYMQPVNATGPTSIAAGGVIIPGMAQTSNPGIEPQQNPGFRKMWKLLHKDQFMLQPGENMSLERKLIYNKRVLRRMLTDIGTNQYVAGLTVFPIIIVDGALTGVGTVGSGGVASYVSPGATKVGILQQDVVSLSAMTANRYTIKRVETGYYMNDSTDIVHAVNDVDVVDTIKQA